MELLQQHSHRYRHFCQHFTAHTLNSTLDEKNESSVMTYNYLLFDPFRGHRQESLSVQDFNFGYSVSVTDDMIDLKENAHII